MRRLTRHSSLVRPAARTGTRVRAAGPAFAAYLAVAGAAACDNSAAVTEPGSTPGLSAADVSRITSEVSAVPAALEVAWAAKDPAAFAAPYAPDARFIAPIGVVQPGRAAVQQQHVNLFNGPFAGSTRATQVDGVLVLSDRHAVVDITIDLSNYRGLPPGLAATTTGASPVLTTRERLILEKRGGTWLIVRNQLTALGAGQPR